VLRTKPIELTRHSGCLLFFKKIFPTHPQQAMEKKNKCSLECYDHKFICQ
jgi:hypothetical protein